ncbi:Rho guanine nucleotide exchange factor, putative [Entamoeba histolytica HM-1:IMSS-B]|uniref:Rho guanine nucleotide exchange factor, putative n=5 Tax=Entamoeba histolytica TaxID=5759 RepID=C4M4E9_ENTH1|nr:Rho guanine nucleotide exchange factor, putative [Entamoeba histolytica HM-1:IMSS]EAL46050.1 Rho guanine nucleotide exchange factor, putative [Entamoeba histolytica HM-1:IMSS]EMH77943.1 Rho guanine nucleotide exchange factor, putative [Entamoeba histolytica HM-1:IMSS-B]ENY60091.1 Rho/RAC guanine nucleotide exchange factor, putative [Entamoeba histolytica HM-1:IMSS-A]GAT96250.1 rho guanine nucleotide exchange factor putative [Entamoeba histolytica]|eukprot:XP_651436.1 Rho guanine nucleotide exchange factor, putative [Entamoeba histolytica HM-1:IMSS]
MTEKLSDWEVLDENFNKTNTDIPPQLPPKPERLTIAGHHTQKAEIKSPSENTGKIISNDKEKDSVPSQQQRSSLQIGDSVELSENQNLIDNSISKNQPSKDVFETTNEPIKPKPETKALSKEDYRERIVNEMFDTEKSYVNSMEICIKGYYEPLIQSGHSVAPADKVNAVFLHFQSVLSINKELLKNMTELKEKGELSTRLGEAFSQFIPMMNVYKLFLGNSDTSLQFLVELEKSSKFNDILDLLRSHLPGDNQLDLRSYLIMPVQRLPRYKLLLTDLIKHTDDDFVDKPKLIDALDKISKLATLVNEVIKERSRNQKLLELVDKIEGLSHELVTPYREYIKSGSLLKICRKDNRERYFYLFNDLLVYGIGDENKIKVSQEFQLESLKINLNQNVPNSFQILAKKSFSVIAKDETDRDEWMKAINDAIQLEKSKLKTLKRDKKAEDEYIAPVWVQDTQNCQVCGAKFTTLFRKHHCRKCGLCICSNCSKQTIIINGKKERVCDSCANNNKKLGESTLTEQNSSESKDTLLSTSTEQDQQLTTSSSNDDNKKIDVQPILQEESNNEQSTSVDVENMNNNEQPLELPKLPPKRKSGFVKESVQQKQQPDILQLKENIVDSPSNEKVVDSQEDVPQQQPEELIPPTVPPKRKTQKTLTQEEGVKQENQPLKRNDSKTLQQDKPSSIETQQKEQPSSNKQEPIELCSQPTGKLQNSVNGITPTPSKKVAPPIPHRSLPPKPLRSSVITSPLTNTSSQPLPKQNPFVPPQQKTPTKPSPQQLGCKQTQSQPTSYRQTTLNKTTTQQNSARLAASLNQSSPRTKSVQPEVVKSTPIKEDISQYRSVRDSPFLKQQRAQKESELSQVSPRRPQPPTPKRGVTK